MSSTDTAKPPSTISERIITVIAWLSVLLVVAIMAVIGLFKLFDPVEPLAILAGVLAVLWLLSIAGIVLAQRCRPLKYRAPTNKEVGKDLLLAVWGGVFTAPLLFLTVEGATIPFSEGWVAMCLALLGLAIPAVRARRR